jgi:hypothetical protein
LGVGRAAEHCLVAASTCQSLTRTAKHERATLPFWITEDADVVITVRPGTIAALHNSRVALVCGRRDGVKAVTRAKTANTPAHRSGGCGDTAHGNEGHDKRDEVFVEHSCEELDR